MKPEPFEERLREYIRTHQIPAELLVYGQSCHSVAEAAQAAGVTPRDLVKSICLVSSESLVVAVVKGEDRASANRVARHLGIERPRPATPEEMLELTGYPCGGTPPFGFQATFLVDERVLSTPLIYAGGGSDRALVRLPSAALAQANGGQLGRFRS